MTIRRVLLTSISVALLWVAGLPGGPVAASAAERTYIATLTDGTTTSLKLDVEPGTPLQELLLPRAVAHLIYSVSDGTDTVLAKDLKIAEEEDPDAAADPGKGHGITNTEPKPEKQGSGTGQRLKPTAKSLKEARKRKARRKARPKNPTYSYALPGPGPIGVPSFFIDTFRIPPFLLPIYQAAGIEYGVRWEVLAAINEIETDYGRNLDVSSAGAVGWMQFMPSTWKAHGVDANDDGKKDPYNPADAIFAAARYLRAAGAEDDIEKAIFAYNHADWYVDRVLRRALAIGKFPTDLIGALTGLAQGRFPVDGTVTYKAGRRSTQIFADRGSQVIAVHDGKITAIGTDDRRGSYIRLRDVFGNSYTYSHLGTIAKTHTVRASEDGDDQDPAPTPATPFLAGFAKAPTFELLEPKDATPHGEPTVHGEAADGLDIKPLRVGSAVTAGTTLGEVGATTERAPYVEFAIRPAGRGAPRIEPTPILDGWKLLDTTAIHSAEGTRTFSGADASQPTIGQILLMSKATLAKRVLKNRRIELYECGRRDVEAGIVDRRVLATLEFLVISDLDPTVTSLRCGHNRLTTSGRVSYHSSGNGVDISAINGTPILGHQGPGSITDETVRKLLTLQAAMKPNEIITLAAYSGTNNTFAMADHDDHIHVGFAPQTDAKLAKQLNAALKPAQWSRLIKRLNEIDNPAVAKNPSEYAITETKQASKKSSQHAD